MKRICITFLALASLLAVRAADPMATRYSIRQCEGSLTPYPAEVPSEEHPDSLAAVFINHVGRHGARYPASSDNCRTLQRALMRADSLGTITQTGRDLLRLTNRVIRLTAGRWGALDSLGMAEQRGIATRMLRSYPRLFEAGNKVEAISSYSPRCVMSMYEFTHQLDRLDNEIEIYTSSGRQNSLLMRPFDVVGDFVEWYKAKPWQGIYDMFFETTAPAAPGRRFVSAKGEELSHGEAAALSWEVYSVLRGLPAMGMDFDLGKYFKPDELNALWACENLGHYLKRSASTLSTEPADVAVALLQDLISTADAAAEGKADATVQLRFGHAETLMPLLSLMHMRGCYYLTNYFDTVALHWRDFDIVPMAANLQMVLFKTAKGRVYVRFALNERAVPLMPDSDDTVIPWSVARNYLLRCLPMHLQI